MKIRVRGGEATAVAADVVIVPVVAGEEDGPDMRALARRVGGAAFKRAVAAARFRGREGQANVLPLQGPRRQAIALVGLGDEARLDLDAWRRAAGHARHLAAAVGADARRDRVRRARRRSDATSRPSSRAFSSPAIASASTSPTARRRRRSTELVLVAQPIRRAEKSLERALDASIEITLAGVTLARDLVNEPAAVKTPTYLATLAKQLGKEAGHRGRGLGAEAHRRREARRPRSRSRAAATRSRASCACATAARAPSAASRSSARASPSTRAASR